MTNFNEEKRKNCWLDMNEKKDIKNLTDIISSIRLNNMDSMGRFIIPIFQPYITVDDFTQYFHISFQEALDALNKCSFDLIRFSKSEEGKKYSCRKKELENISSNIGKINYFDGRTYQCEQETLEEIAQLEGVDLYSLIDYYLAEKNVDSALTVMQATKQKISQLESLSKFVELDTCLSLGEILGTYYDIEEIAEHVLQRAEAQIPVYHRVTFDSLVEFEAILLNKINRMYVSFISEKEYEKILKQMEEVGKGESLSEDEFLDLISMLQKKQLPRNINTQLFYNLKETLDNQKKCIKK